MEEQGTHKPLVVSSTLTLATVIKMPVHITLGSKIRKAEANRCNRLAALFKGIFSLINLRYRFYLKHPINPPCCTYL